LAVIVRWGRDSDAGGRTVVRETGTGFKRFGVVDERTVRRGEWESAEWGRVDCGREDYGIGLGWVYGGEFGDTVDPDSLKVHVQVKGEGIVWGCVRRVSVVVKRVRMGGKGVIRGLGRDSQSGGWATRGCVRSKEGVSVVWIDGKKLQLKFVKCSEARIKFRLEQIGMRGEDVWRWMGRKEIEAWLLREVVWVKRGNERRGGG
jgi:hypothetical protein